MQEVNNNQLNDTGELLDLLSGMGGPINPINAINPSNPASIIFQVMSDFLNRKQSVQGIKDNRQPAMPQPEENILDRIRQTSAYMQSIVPAKNTLPSYMPTNTSPGQSYQSSSTDTAFDQALAATESKGNYSSYNPANGGEGAVGKYQFRWHLWKDKIASVTGISNKQTFLSAPAAQEHFYSWYKQNQLMPAVNRLQQYNNSYSRDQLARLVHFKGEAGAKQWLLSGTDNTTRNNMPIEKYIGKN